MGRESSEQLLPLRMKTGGILLETKKYSNKRKRIILIIILQQPALPNPGKLFTLR